MSLSPGIRLGHYDVTALIGEGGMGQVWQATDTQDLVQETALQTFKRIEAFEPRGQGAFQAYLRQALMNRIRSEFRHKGRTPTTVQERVPTTSC